MSKLTKCRACNQEISQNAQTCPNCGEPVKKQSKIGCGTIILLLLIIGMIAGQCEKKKPTSQVKTDSSSISSSEACLICGNRLEAMAKYDHDYSILDFSHRAFGDRWVVRFPVKLQNGFGAWQKREVYCEVRKQNPNPSVTYNDSAILKFEVR